MKYGYYDETGVRVHHELTLAEIPDVDTFAQARQRVYGESIALKAIPDGETFWEVYYHTWHRINNRNESIYFNTTEEVCAFEATIPADYHNWTAERNALTHVFRY